MRILITGGAGFVGFHLASKFVKEGKDVTILDNFARPNEDKEYKDLLKNDKLQFLQTYVDQKSK